ncbi:MAG TPA: methylenetetrahydrofolate reductase [bacterium]|nr:methylenetetrahydrofolate reductase [bacterium]HPM45661.1 methylenetetrahydrofolate reductase [bacterium]HRQ70373.1 methylenetetrahydrofolate reductase [bacterium]
MRIDEFIKNRSNFFFSLEVTPPDRGRSVTEIFETIDILMPFDPKFINVTYHQPHISYKTENGIKSRFVYRKKPGTVGICSAIQSRYGIDAVPHLLCGGVDKWEIEDTIVDLNYLGFDNIFALRGDPAFGMTEFVPKEDGYRYASELVAHISRMNSGCYLDDELKDGIKTNFCVGVAAYPEKHIEAESIENDIGNLKKKVEEGANFIVTQMCFDAEVYVRFVNKLRNIGVTVPVIPGVRPLTSSAQLEIIPSTFGVSVPQKLKETMSNAKTKSEEFEAGTSFVADLCRELIEKGAPGIHLFTMGKGKSAKALFERIKAGV